MAKINIGDGYRNENRYIFCYKCEITQTLHIYYGILNKKLKMEPPFFYI